MFNPFNPFRSQAQATWHRIGLVSELPDLGDDEGYRIAPRCKALNVPKEGGIAEPVEDIDIPGDMKDQVLVFKYKGKVHAIDHQCPHSAFPLSQGRLFDIEDFGITLSTGIMCSKHDWSFDIITGNSDRGTYRLKVWEVQLRDPPATVEGDDKEVWVRRKQRVG